MQIPFTDEERITGTPTLAHVEEALAALHRDGIIYRQETLN
jgi:hypothetical protein